MLTVEQALALCLDAPVASRTVSVRLDGAYGRVLAESVAAPMPSPRWDNSAMDGFALRAADTGWSEGLKATGSSCDSDGDLAPGGVVLRVTETIGAGSVGSVRVEPGTCVRIMTGAPVPEGADAVVMREGVEVLDGERVRVAEVARPGQHVRYRGEEYEEGAVLLEPGTVLTASSVGLCAALGRRRVTVADRPRVAIVSTGDEVVPPGEPLGPGQIWSSNSAALVGLVREAGGEAIDCGIAPDDLEGTRAAFRRALDADPDLVVSTGGVSVGDFDVVKEALASEGAEMRFWKVRVKPGKPLAFGMIGGVPAFGLPGNPVSTMVGFLQFVRPVIRRALGDPRPFLPVVKARLTAAIRRKAGRNEFVRVALRWDGAGLVADAIGSQSSGQTSSMALSHGFVLLDAPSPGADAGALVSVQIFDPGFLAGATPAYDWTA